MASEPREVWGDLPASAFVQASHLFKSLDDEARQDLLKLARTQTFQPGEVLVREGEPGEDFFLVREGTAVVTRERGGGVLELGMLERGAFFGEFHVLTGGPRIATVSARTDVEVIRFPSPMIAALAERFPKVMKLLDTVKAAREKDTAHKLGA